MKCVYEIAVMCVYENKWVLWLRKSLSPIKSHYDKHVHLQLVYEVALKAELRA